MSWLGTWAKRRKVTVSNTNIDSNLTHFPLLLTLGTSVGTGSTDVSSIFDELTSDANRKKIAFTKTDGATQLFAEIEKWDDANETAVIWVSKSDLVLASGATTEIYMYYDSTQDDNTNNVGDTNSEVAESVYDANHKLVWHLADGVSTSAVYDSTSNDNDGTKEAANKPLEATGLVGKGQAVDEAGNDENILIGDLSQSNLTLKLWFKTSATDKTANQMMINKGFTSHAAPYYEWALYLSASYEVRGVITVGGASYSTPVTTSAYNDGDWHLAVLTYDGETLSVNIDGGSEIKTNTTMSGDSTSYATNAYLSKYTNVVQSLAQSFTGSYDDFCISDTARSAAWIKANYYSETDALVAWGAEETGATEFTVTISETITTTEVLARPVNYNKSFAETFSITEALSVLKAVLIDVSESIGITETLTKASAYAKAFSANISITEALTASQKYLLNLVESISITETLTKLTSYIKSKTESFSITDSLSFVDKYWKELTKHTSTYTGTTKNTSSWTNQKKNVH